MRVMRHRLLVSINNTHYCIYLICIEEGCNIKDGDEKEEGEEYQGISDIIYFGASFEYVCRC